MIQLWSARLLTAIPALMLTFSAIMKLRGGPDLDAGFAHLGWPSSLAFPLGVLELAITVLYLIPRTSFFGAILITGYLGGAMATHIRIGEPWFIQFLLGVAAWAGLTLRNPRLREIIIKP